eukprot:193462_1
MPTFQWNIKGLSFKAMKLSKFDTNIESPRWSMYDGAFHLVLYPNGYSHYSPSSNDSGTFVGRIDWVKSGNEKWSTIGLTIIISLIETNQSLPISARVPSTGAGCFFKMNDVTFASIQKCDSLTIKVEVEMTFALDAQDKDLSYLYTDQTEAKQPDSSGTAEVLKQSTYNSLQTKFDELQTNMHARLQAIENRLQTIELEMNSEQKTNTDNRYDNVMKEIQAIRSQMNTVSHHANINPEQQKLKQWLESDVRLPQYYNVFVENGIEDLTTAALLTMETLKAMGIDKIGHQMKVLNMVIKLKDNEGSTAYIG